MLIMRNSTFAVALAASLTFAGCSGSTGDPGPIGIPGENGSPGVGCTVVDNGDGSKLITCTDGTTVTVVDGQASALLSGTVTNSLTSEPIEGASIALTPAVDGVTLATDAAGAYSSTLPIGAYKLTFTATGYNKLEANIVLVAGQSATASAVLVPTAAVVINAAASATTVNPGGESTLAATLQSFNGATATSYTWTQVSGVPADLSSTTGASIVVTLGNATTYKNEIWTQVGSPDRLRVVGVSPFALAEAAAAVFEVSVVASDGKTYKAQVTVNASMPVGTSLGIQNVPVGVPVMVHAPTALATGSFKTVADVAGSLDGKTFTVSDGTNTFTFELDTDGVSTAGAWGATGVANIRVKISAGALAADVASAVKAAINGVDNLPITAAVAPAVDLTLVQLIADNPGLTTGSIDVGTTGFTNLIAMGGDGAYAWTLKNPSGTDITSDAALGLDSASAQNAIFKPTLEGKYALTLAAHGAVPAASLDIFSGKWMGAIEGINTNGTPKTDTCDSASCHTTPSIKAMVKGAADEWRQSGHAQIFAQNVDTSPGHYSTSCLECHTVGYNTSVANGGIDDAADWNAFEATFVAADGGIHGAAGNWVEIVDNYSTVAALANIQCENCHGPGGSLGKQGAGYGHGGTPGAPNPARFSIDSEVCGSCHGEPPRHGRFEQWVVSGHGNEAMAAQEAAVDNRAVSKTSAGPGHCGRCHSGEGFVQWITEPDLNNCVGTTYMKTAPASGGPAHGPYGTFSCTSVSAGNGVTEYTNYLVSVGMTADKVHGQDCAVCHDPHAQGTTSGEPNTATVRVEGSTKLLPAGFAAVAVGKGALCITCHNTRQGAVPVGDVVGLNPASYTGTPHTPSQGDLLMGYNAYFVPAGLRSSHADIQDTCVNCHMEKSNPPSAFSYQYGGTNHAFGANLEICADCHGEGIDGEGIQAQFEAGLSDIADLLTTTLKNRITQYLTTTYKGVRGKLTLDPANLPTDGETFALNDGRGNSKTFQFYKTVAMGTGNVKVDISSAGTDAGKWASAIVSAVNGATTAGSTTIPYGFTPGTSFQVTAFNKVDLGGTALSDATNGNKADVYLVLDYATAALTAPAAITDNTAGSKLAVSPLTALNAGEGSAISYASASYIDANGASHRIDDYSLIAITQAPTSIVWASTSQGGSFDITFPDDITVKYNRGAGVAGPSPIRTIRVGAASIRRAIPTGDASGIDLYAYVPVRLFDESFDTFWKSIWNYALLKNDASGGIHNPSLENAILENTYSKLLTAANCVATAWTGTGTSSGCNL